ncbi:MAG: hypothetical protein GF334_02000 [Candidatus Altiarchaeales archaeon]|nr:hypothetical protein [Candidatus Altiarchaeales archaeon]
MRNEVLIFLLVLLLNTQDTQAQDKPYLAEFWNYSAKEFISGLRVSDVTGDGVSEVLLTGSSDGSTYRLNGDGSLRWIYNGGGYVNEVSSLDSIVLSAYPKHLYLIDDNGTRTGSYMTGDPPYVIETGDVSGDGVEDIVLGVYDALDCGSKNKVIALEADRSRLFEYRTKSTEIPFKIEIADLDKDGLNEVIVGLVFKTKNQGTCNPVYDQPSRVLALNQSGDVIWSYETPGGVLSLEAADLESDGKPEVLVGSAPDFLILESDGRLRCSHPGVSRVEGLTHARRGEQVLVAFASDEVYVLDGACRLNFTGDTQTRVYSIESSDLDGDGVEELIAGSNRLHVFSLWGEQLHQSESLLSVGFLSAGDLTGDGNKEVLAGAGKTIYAYKCQIVGERVKAEQKLEGARQLYEVGQLNRARDYAEQAVNMYSEIGFSQKALEALNLHDRIREEIQTRERIEDNQSTKTNKTTLTPDLDKKVLTPILAVGLIGVALIGLVGVLIYLFLSRNVLKTKTPKLVPKKIKAPAKPRKAVSKIKRRGVGYAIKRR